MTTTHAAFREPVITLLSLLCLTIKECSIIYVLPDRQGIQHKLRLTPSINPFPHRQALVK